MSDIPPRSVMCVSAGLASPLPLATLPFCRRLCTLRLRRVWTSSLRHAHNTRLNAPPTAGVHSMNPGFEEIMAIRGRGMPADGEVSITGQDPVFSARFKIGETTANILGGIGVAVTDIHEMKTGKRQKVAIDVRHAA